MATNTVIYSCQQVPKPCDIIIKIISIIIIIIMTTTIMYKSLGVWDPNVSDFSRHPGENKLFCLSSEERRLLGCIQDAKTTLLMFLLLQIVVKMDFRSVVSGQLQEYLCWCVF